ncbi:hypothetical protein [Rhizobium halophytocola]|uniref:Uncharacterized protein n=1 Tax=Rhizobium halophytocola TaxID=735519 RepID=A0ABS4DSA7_9HYPH|nr:hypothetical protein [Rhizobium halophytocola]MBP1848586.1 hypothetical protein [Rhizobium halophytocola]
MPAANADAMSFVMSLGRAVSAFLTPLCKGRLRAMSTGRLRLLRGRPAMVGRRDRIADLPDALRRDVGLCARLPRNRRDAFWQTASRRPAGRYHR